MAAAARHLVLLLAGLMLAGDAWSQASSIRGRVINDMDASGGHTPGDTVLPGLTLTLNGTQASAVSDANGDYEFRPISAGSHTVCVVVPTGWKVTTSTGACRTGTVPDSASVDMDFALVQLGSISGSVWEDTDGDGVRDAGESGLSGWTVSDGTNSTTSASNGTYTLSDLVPATYTVSQTLQTGYTQTFPTGAGTHSVVLAAGANETGKDFGNQPSVGAVVVTAYNDFNRNGAQDSGEGGKSGIELRLLNTSGDELEVATTDANGEASFSRAPGTYRVQLTKPDGFVFGGQTGFDSDSNTFTSVTVTTGANTSLVVPVQLEIYLLYPIGGAQIVNTLTTFDWSDAAGTSSYTLNLTDVTNGTANQQAATLTASMWTATSALVRSTTYDWRVDVRDTLGNTWTSGTERFTLGSADLNYQLESVDPHSIRVTVPNPVRDADTYRVQVDRDEDYSTSDADTTGGSTILVSGLEEFTLYNVRVRIENRHDNTSAGLTYTDAGPWAVVQTIRTLPGGPPAEGPQPTFPVDHSFIPDLTPEFEWRPIGADPHDGSIDYNLLVASSPTFNASAILIDEEGLADTYQTPNPSPFSDGDYAYWRVRARNAAGYGPWGPIYEVGFDLSPPSAFTLTAFADGDGDGALDDGEVFVRDVTGVLTGTSGTEAGRGTTDANGRLTLSELRAGSYQLRVQLPDGLSFAPNDRLNQEGEGQVTLTAGETLEMDVGLLYPILGVSPNEADFGLTQLGQSEVIVLNVSNTGFGPYTGTATYSDSDGVFGGDGASVQLSVPAQSSTTVPVAYTPTAAQASSGSLVFQPADPISTPRTVSLTGTGVPGQMTLSESALDFGQVAGTDSRTLQLALTNTGIDVLTLNQLELTGNPEFTVIGSLPATLAAGASHSLSVRLMHAGPMTNATYAGVLSISATDQGVQGVSTSLSGLGIPLLGISSTSLDFGQVPIVASSSLGPTMTVTLANNHPSHAVHLLTEPSPLPLFHAGYADPTAAPMLPGESINHLVQFSPTSLGVFTQTQELDLVDESIGLEIQSIATLTYTGEGIAADQVSIGDLVWHDVDSDGLQDGGEPGVAGAVVTLRQLDENDGSWTEIGTTTTDNSGNYLFEGLDPGVYGLVLDIPTGFGITLPDQGFFQNDEDSDASICCAEIAPITTGLTAEILDYDFGLSDAVGSIGDLVFEDTNRDGIQNLETGLEGVELELFKVFPAGETSVGVETTDAFGAFEFSDLLSGAYRVQLTVPAGFSPSPQDAGLSDVYDSDFDIAGSTSEISLQPGEVNFFTDAGLMPNLARTIQGTLFTDHNANGVQDEGEQARAGVSVTLADASGAPIDQATSGPDGSYRFPSGSPGSPTDIPSGCNVLLYDAGDLLSTLGPDTDPVTGGSKAICLDDSNRSADVNIGFAAPASVGDFVWQDLNGDGNQDAGEPGMQGVQLTLVHQILTVTTGGEESPTISSPALVTIATTTSDENGAYLFSGVFPGSNYRVSYAPLSGYVGTAQDDGASDASDSDFLPGPSSFLGYTTDTFDLASGEANTTIDLGLITSTSSVSGIVWDDANRDGIRFSEPGISRVVYLEYKLPSPGCSGNDGIPSGGVIADGDGMFSFDDLPQGCYRIAAFQEPPPSTTFQVSIEPYGPTLPGQDSDLDGMTTGWYELGPNESATDVGIGLVRARVTGSVFVDSNLDGEWQTGVEPPAAAGLAVQALCLSSNCDFAAAGLPSVVATQPNGSFQMDLPTAFSFTSDPEYRIQFSAPPGFGYTVLGVDSQADPTSGEAPVFSSSMTNLDFEFGAGLLSGARIQVINANWEINSLTCSQDGTVVAESLGYLEASPFATIPAGSRIDCTGQTPAGEIQMVSEPVQSGVDTEVIPLGLPGVQPILILFPSGQLINTQPDSDGFEGRFYWDSGTIPSAGTLQFAESRELDGEKSFATRTVVNTGTVEWTSGSVGFSAVLVSGFENPNGDQPSGGVIGVLSDGTVVEFIPADATATVEGVVWFDSLVNPTIVAQPGQPNLRDAAEPRFPDVPVDLLNASGAVVASTLTDAAGFYRFIVPPGTYQAQFLAGLPYVTPDAGDESLDSDVDPATGLSDAGTLTGGDRQVFDAGIQVGDDIEASSWNFQFLAFDDVNLDGIAGSQEDAGLPLTSQVSLHAADGTLISSAVAIDGLQVSVIDALPGEYYLTFSHLLNWGFTARNVGSNELVDSDIDETGQTEVFPLGVFDLMRTINEWGAGYVKQVTIQDIGPFQIEEGPVNYFFTEVPLVGPVPVVGNPGAAITPLVERTPLLLGSVVSLIPDLGQGIWEMELVFGTDDDFLTTGDETFPHELSISSSDPAYDGLVIPFDVIVVDSGESGPIVEVPTTLQTTELDVVDRTSLIDLLPNVAGVTGTISGPDQTEVSASIGPSDTNGEMVITYRGLQDFAVDGDQTVMMEVTLQSSDPLFDGVTATITFENEDSGLRSTYTLGGVLRIDPDLGTGGPLPGVRVVVRDAETREELTSATTGPDGRWQAEVGPRDIVIELETDLVSTNAVGWRLRESDVMTVGGDEDLGNLDLTLAQPATVFGSFYFDGNLNGTQDQGEVGDPAFVESMVLMRRDASGQILEIATADPSLFPNYSFQVSPGLSDYALVVNRPAQGPLMWPVTSGAFEWTTYPGTDYNVVGFLSPQTPGGTQQVDLAGATSVVSGVVWEDLNQNGVREGGEPPVEGVLVLVAPDAIYDVYHATSQQDGSYSVDVTGTNWDVYPPGSSYGFFSHDLSSRPGFVPTIQSSESRIGYGDLEFIRWAFPRLYSDYGLGIHEEAAASGIVWEDTNGNGIREHGEPRLSGVTVVRDNGDFTQTDQNGRYSFGHPPGHHGVYSLRVFPPGGYTFADQDAGTDDLVDSDFDPGTEETPDLLGTNNNVGAGLIPASIVAGELWTDTNGNGVRETGDDWSGETISVRLRSSESTRVVESTGSYSFGSVPAGQYTLFVPGTATPANQGSDDDHDSDYEPGIPFVVPAASTVELDVGLWPAQASETVWVQFFNNSPDVPSLTIQVDGAVLVDNLGLHLASGAHEISRSSTVRGSGSVGVNGSFVVQTEDWSFSTRGSGPQSPILLVASTGTGASTGQQPISLTFSEYPVLSPVVINGQAGETTISAGRGGVTLNPLESTSITDLVSFVSIICLVQNDGPFCFVEFPIGGLTYQATTQDVPSGQLANLFPTDLGAIIVTGTPDTPVVVGTSLSQGTVTFALAQGTITGEVRHTNGVGLEGFAVSAVSAEVLGAFSTVTNSSGIYALSGLPVANYIVSVMAPSSNWTEAFTGGGRAATVTGGQTTTVPHFLFDDQFPGLTLLGQIYEDRNGDGDKDAGEAGLGGLTVTATVQDAGLPALPAGTVVQTTSAINGSFNITLERGVWELDVTVPFGLRQTGSSAQDGPCPQTGCASPVRTVDLSGLIAAEAMEDVSFGLQLVPTELQVDATSQSALAAAIETANSGSGTYQLDLTSLGSAGKRQTTLNLSAPLPEIEGSVIINGGGELTINGAGAGIGADGLRISGQNSVISGVELRNFRGNGVVLSGSNTIVEANEIVGAGRDGIRVTAGTGHTLRENRIVGTSGLPIDLGADGATVNDPTDTDTGPNNLQNTPLLAQALSGSLEVTGSLTSAAGTEYHLDFFLSDGCGVGDAGLAGQFVGSITVTTDATGAAAYTASLGVPAYPGQYIAATATSAGGDTSELSPCTPLEEPMVTGVEEPVEEPTPDLPHSFALHQNYPNPFNPMTRIRYELPQAVQVRLEVFDVLGRRVSLLVDQTLSAGQHEVLFDASRLASGVYFYRLQTAEFAQVRQMVLVR